MSCNSGLGESVRTGPHLLIPARLVPTCPKPLNHLRLPWSTGHFVRPPALLPTSDPVTGGNLLGDLVRTTAASANCLILLFSFFMTRFFNCKSRNGNMRCSLYKLFYSFFLTRFFYCKSENGNICVVHPMRRFSIPFSDTIL